MSLKIISPKVMKKCAILLFCSFALVACASSPNSSEQTRTEARYSDPQDPIEPVNRTMFAFNQAVEFGVVTPVSRAYDVVLPNLVKDGIRNFINHLRSPLNFINSILQGNFDQAAEVFGRFTLNTIAGFGGIFDPAKEMGLPYKGEDFGQTLAVWGFGPGPYLVLPIIGPSNLRDMTGRVVDFFANPVKILTSHTHLDWTPVAVEATAPVDSYARNYDKIQTLRSTSLDYYNTVKSLYNQRRQGAIENREFSGRQQMYGDDDEIDIDQEDISSLPDPSKH